MSIIDGNELDELYAERESLRTQLAACREALEGLVKLIEDMKWDEECLNDQPEFAIAWGLLRAPATKG